MNKIFLFFNNHDIIDTQTMNRELKICSVHGEGHILFSREIWGDNRYTSYRSQRKFSYKLGCLT